MSRQDALHRLHENLVEKRDALRRQLSEDLDLAHTEDTGTGDEADVAHEGALCELHSQLAALESRELAQIERAISLIRKGRYGICEHCQSRIPVARLKALPFSTTCVNCQQRQESRLGRFETQADWENLYEYEGSHVEKEITIGDHDLN